jgi:hypothetical protein
MRKFSEYQIARIILGIVLTFWLIIMCIIVLNASLSCVDSNGCLKSQCKFAWLNKDYRALVLANNETCFYLTNSDYNEDF